MQRSSLACRVGVAVTLAGALLGRASYADSGPQAAKAPQKKASASVSDAGPCSCPTNGLRPVIGVGPGFFFEETDRVQDQHANGDRTEFDRTEFVSDGFLSLQAWALFPVLFKTLRAGGGVAWYNGYALAFPEDEDDNNDDELYHVGHTFQLFGQGEFVLADLAGKLDLILGLRGGGILVSAGAELQDELDGFERQAYDIWRVPRPGMFISPHAGVAWPLNARLSLRADLAVQFSKIWLYGAESEVQGSLMEVDSQLETTRTQLLVGLEIGL